MYRGSLLENAEHRRLILEAVRAGVSPRQAFLKLGYHRNSFANWVLALRRGKYPDGTPVTAETLERIAEFMEQMAQAMAEGEQRLVEIINDAAGRKNEKTGLVDWQPAKFLLTHGPYRERWYMHQPQEIDVRVHGVEAEFREVRNLTESELVEGLDDPDWAQALLPRVVTEG